MIKKILTSAIAKKSAVYITASVILFSIFALPIFALAWSPGDPIVPNQCYTNTGGCGWNDLMEMGQNIMYFAIYLMTICAVVAIAYAGFLYASAGGSDSQISKAHGIFTKVIWGIFFVLGAWLIVQTILTLLGVQDGFSLLG